MQNEKKMTESRENYKAPKCEIIEMKSESVLCSSDYSADHEGFEDDYYTVEW